MLFLAHFRDFFSTRQVFLNIVIILILVPRYRYLVLPQLKTLLEIIHNHTSLPPVHNGEGLQWDHRDHWVMGAVGVSHTEGSETTTGHYEVLSVFIQFFKIRYLQDKDKKRF